jgi:hypothetical protein
MRRYKLTIHILVILSVFNFVLAAPIAVLRKACADMADEGEDMRIVSGKRAEPRGDPWAGLTPASPGSGSMSVQVTSPGDSMSVASSSSSPGSPPGPPPTSDHPSGVHQEMTNPIQVPSSAPGGHRPWYSLDDIRWSSYSPGGTALPWKSPGDTGPHSITPGRDRPQLFRPGTSNKIEPGWSVRTRPPNKPTTEIEPGETPPPSSGKVVPPSDQIIPPSPSEVLPPPEQVPPESSSEVLPSSEQVPPKSSSEILPSSEQEGLAQTPTVQTKSKSKSFLSNLASSSKTFLSNFPSKSKTFLSNLPSKSKTVLSNLVTNSKTFLSNLPSKSKAVFSNLATNSKTFLSNVASKSKSLFGKLASKPKVSPVVL